MAFGYFELLLKTGDSNRIGMEYARITSLNNLMNIAGLESYIYEDFAEATFSLFGQISASPVIDNPYDVSEVVNAFNDPDISNAIITHFKVRLPATYRCFQKLGTNISVWLVSHKFLDENPP